MSKVPPASSPPSSSWVVTGATEPARPGTLGAGRGELVEGAAEQGAQRHGRVGGEPAPDRDLGGGDDGAGQDLRVHVLLPIGPGPRRDRLGQGLVHLGGDLQVLAADGGPAAWPTWLSFALPG